MVYKSIDIYSSGGHVDLQMQKCDLPMSDDRAIEPVTLLSSIITLQVYVPSSPSIRYSNLRVLRKLLSLEVIGLMVTLLSFVMTPLGPIQLIITELSSAPTAPLIVQVKTSGLPTIRFWRLDNVTVTIRVPAVCIT